MAIATDATAKSTGSAATSKTWSHTCAGSDRILIVHGWNNSVNGATTFTGCTYNGVAMTSLGSSYFLAVGGYTEVFYLAGPATGTHDIVLSQSASQYVAGISASYTGVKQTSPLSGTVTQNTTVTTNEATTVATTDDNSWVVAAVAENGGGAQTAGANTVARLVDVALMNGGIYDSNSAVTPAGNYTLNFNGTGVGRTWVDIAFAMAPAGAAVVATKNLTLLGAG